MIVIGKEKIIAFIKKHSNAQKSLTVWLAETKKAQWKTPHDIKQHFRSVDFLADNRAIFNIKGNHYRLVVKVRYINGIVKIEWIGTHAEYDKKKF